MTCDPVECSASPMARAAGIRLLLCGVSLKSTSRTIALFTTLGKELSAAPDHDEVVRAMGAAIAAVKKIGRSDVGQKTMLDVLSPVHEELAAGGTGLPDRSRQRAAAAADATVPMKATKGRASFLGERSIGHLDPGARSSSLIIAAICTAMED